MSAASAASRAKSNRSRIRVRTSSSSFLAFTRTRSGTEIFPKSWRSAAVFSSRISSREKVTSAYGPWPARSTIRASVSVRSATRLLWPAVEGSRCSTATMAAWAKSSKSLRMEAVRRFAFRLTAACVASERTSGTRSSGYPSNVPGSAPWRFIICRTPTSSPRWSFIGTTRTARVRHPEETSNCVLWRYGASFGIA